MTKNGFQDQLSLNAGQKYCRMLPLEHSAIVLTCIKLPFVIKIFVLSVFLSGCFTQVLLYYTLQRANNKCADLTAYMHRLVWAFIFCIQQNRFFFVCFFSIMRPNNDLLSNIHHDTVNISNMV